MWICRGASYLRSSDSVPAALRLHLDDEALDEDSDQPAFGSLGDVVRAFLNSEGLYEAIDDGLLGRESARSGSL